MTNPPKIFVSYSHKDRAWLERLQVHFKALERDGNVDLWDDTEIKFGADWDTEISSALENAKASILLVSADFLASDYIANEELNNLLKAGEEKGLLNLMVIISPCVLGKLTKFQSVNDPEEPLEGMTKVEQEMVFVKLVETIKRVLTIEPHSELPVDQTKPASQQIAIPQIKLVVGHQDTPDAMPNEYLFHQKKITIGRDPSNDLKLSDRNRRIISKRHAEISCDAGKLCVTDLDSMNFTHLNGKRLQPHQTYEMQPGSLIQIGPFKIGLESLGTVLEEDSTQVNIANPYKDDVNELLVVLQRIADQYDKDPTRRDKAMLENALHVAMKELERNDASIFIARRLLSEFDSTPQHDHDY